jgi:hypothetical protein
VLWRLRGAARALGQGGCVSERTVCGDCGGGDAATFLWEIGPLCDSCFDARISAATEFPRLPDPPAPILVTGPDGRAHRMRLRLVRNPGGVCAEAVEEPGGLCCVRTRHRL